MLQVSKEICPIEQLTLATPIEPVESHTERQSVKSVQRPHIATEAINPINNIDVMITLLFLSPANQTIKRNTKFLAALLGCIKKPKARP